METLVIIERMECPATLSLEFGWNDLILEKEDILQQHLIKNKSNFLNSKMCVYFYYRINLYFFK